MNQAAQPTARPQAWQGRQETCTDVFRRLIHDMRQTRERESAPKVWQKSKQLGVVAIDGAEWCRNLWVLPCSAMAPDTGRMLTRGAIFTATSHACEAAWAVAAWAVAYEVRTPHGTQRQGQREREPAVALSLSLGLSVVHGRAHMPHTHTHTHATHRG
jgi:hypothetical protein